MTQDQIGLFKSHEDIAQLACTGEMNCLMILDLNDPKAFEFASAFSNARELSDKRDFENTQGKIAASTVVMPIEDVNTYRELIMGVNPLPNPRKGMIYMILCSEGRFQVVELESLTTSMKTK